uniref:NADH-ubiquinone oxidoreductase chain 2 n=1 Tax=Mileewa lamellata TaxID=2984022 RepID=A0A977XV12_9HEMI|nr:NADH dehydrogenase subunit 2 [Mileewa lamellata]UXX17540.1 NADH dehydrogenase subunit 2 [Mileewa lamellata]
MKLNLTNTFMFYILMIGVIISISSNNWMMMWSGLEISLMSFIPLMSGGVMGSESSMKYFIVQSISSSMLIISIMMMISMNLVYNFIMLTSLILKMGVAPFHNWVLSIVSSLNYKLMLILFSIIKIAPLVMLSFLNSYNDLFIILSLIIGSFFSLNQNNIRKLMGYSSIYNMSYIISSINMNSIWSIYLILYSIILIFVIILISKLKINYINQFMINEQSMIIKMNLSISMLSLGGLPPLLGFFPKFIIFQIMIKKKMFVLTILMILTSLLMMFFYMRMMFLLFLNYSTMMKILTKMSSKFSIWSLFLNTNIFPFIVSFKYFT